MVHPNSTHQSTDEITRKGESDEAVLRHLLDTLPIYAMRVGYRTNCTEEQKRFGQFLFDLHKTWLDFKAEAQS